MVDLTSKFGRVMERHLNYDYVIWLTTVDSNLAPQPRPVWFIWEENTFLIFSQAKAHKVRHIVNNPMVALNLNTDEMDEEHVLVFLGNPSIDMDCPPAYKVPEYFHKYESGITDLDMTPEEFSRDPNQAFRSTRMGVKLPPTQGGFNER
jgi:PPOX class probable F420-dependent enzyme